MKKVLILGIALLGELYSNGCTSNDTISIADALKQELVEAQFTSVGGHRGHCVNAHISNETGRYLILRIDPGLRLVSKDEKTQDILLVQERIVELGGRSNRSVMLYGFCCQAPNRSPRAGMDFTLGPKAQGDLLRVCSMINHADYPQSTAQHAIWAMTDNHPVEAVTHTDKTAIRELLKFISSAKGVPFPWYSLFFVEREDRPFTDRPKELAGNFDYSIQHTGLVSLVIYNQHGAAMTTPINHQEHTPGDYSLSLNMDVLDWKKGNYYLKLYHNSEVLQEQEIRL